MSACSDVGQQLQIEGKDMTVDCGRQMDAWRELWGQYQAIIDAFDGLIYICSQAYEVEFVNRRLAETLGYSPLGQKCHQAFYNLDQPCPKCFKEKLRRGETVRKKGFDPQKNRICYQVASPVHLQGEAWMMVTIQYLPINCPTQVTSLEPGGASENGGERNVA